MALDVGPMDHALDPEMLPIVRAMRERMAERTPMTEIAPAQMRARASADFAPWNADAPAVAEVRDLMIADAPPLRARLYRPEAASDGLLVHFHGGGWVIGDVELEDRACRVIAAQSDVSILSVEYRLAPEAKFPIPVQDCVRAAQWAYDNAKALGFNAERIGIGGASAGANLALAAALALRDEGETPAFLLLLYGVFAMRTDTESYRLYGGGAYGLGTAALDFFMAQYLRTREDRDDPRASPLDADLAGLPPSFLIIAGADPLRDDSRMLAEKMRRAGVAADAREYAGVLHGFTQFALKCAKGREALADAAAALRAHLG